MLRKAPTFWALLLLLGCATISPGQVPPANERRPDDPIALKSASSHPIKYYCSLPKGYQRAKDKRWPVLVCVEGAGCNFRDMAETFVQARGDLPVLVVVPCTFSNTNRIWGQRRQRYLQLYSAE